MAIAFGHFTVDQATRQLRRGGEGVRLSPKGFHLLSILVDASPRAISKADLQDQLWPATFVTEGSLATLVTELRSALGDDARHPRYIRTLYGFGYAFAARTQTTSGSPAQQSSPSPRQRRLGHLTSAAAFGAIGVVLILASRSTTESAASITSPPAIRSLAVLAFDTSGADRDDQHLGIGLADLVITRLTNAHEIVVRPTSAILEVARERIDSEAAGRKLKVDAVLEGTVRTSADRIRVTVQLLNVHDNKPVWAERFDERRSDIFTIEDSLSGKLAEALHLQLAPAERLQLGKRSTSNGDAYQAYVQGAYHIAQSGPANYFSDEPLRAIEFFQKAVDKDPRFAAAWAGLSRAYFLAGVFSLIAPRTAWANARSCAQKAIELDPTLPEAYTLLGDVAAYLDLQYDHALQLYSQAVQLNPRNTYAVLHYAYLLQALGHFDQAIALRKLMAEIDPVSTNSHWGLALAYITCGQYNLAAREVQTILSMDPNHAEAHIALIRLAIARGDYDAAIAEARTDAANPQNTRALAFLGYALARAGRRNEAKAVLQQIAQRSINEKKPLYFNRAVVYAGLGDTDHVIPLLEKGLEDREYALRLKTEPVFIPFHSDPRYAALLQRAGFKN